MGSGASQQRSSYELSHSLDAEDEPSSSRRSNSRNSFVLEKVDIPANLLAESGQIRHDVVQPSVLDVPSLSRYPYVDYRFVKKIGNGRFSTVYKAVNLQDAHIKVAIKEMKLKDMTRNEWLQCKYELNVLSQLHHPSIVRMAAVYNPSPSSSGLNVNLDSSATNNISGGGKLYTVTEYLRGGEILAAISQRSDYFEEDIRRLMKELLSALAYLHKRGVQHRRIIPENLILSHPSFKKATLKIVDFGHAESTVSKRSNANNRLDPYFSAPELFNNKEKPTNAVDLWSFGVILSVLLTGKCPLEETDNIPFMHPVHSFEDDEDWETVSINARDMLCKLLVGNPLLRPSAEDLLQHPWFQEHTILPTGPRLSNASNNSFNTQKKTTNKLRVTDPELEVSLHDLTRNLPQIRAFRERRLASHSLLVSSGVVTFLKVDRYANEKNYARLSDCSTLSGSTNRGEDSEEDQDSDEEEEVRRKQVDVEMKATMLPSRSARMKC